MADEPSETAMEAWGRPHALTYDESPDLGDATPLLRDGDSRAAFNGLTGELGGRPVTICQYSFAVIGIEPGGGTGDYTIAVVDEVRSPVDGLALRPKRPLGGNPFRRRARIARSQPVRLGSARARRHYKLAVADGVPEWRSRGCSIPSCWTGA